MVRTRVRPALLLACCGLLWAAGQAAAAPADLDRSFGGGDGIAEVRGPGGAQFPVNAGARMAIGPHDEIFALYSNYTPSCESANCTIELSVVRYGPNGELDSSFGAGATPQLVVHQSPYDHDFGLAVGPDGKPVISVNGSLVRLGLDGRPDPTFGVGGKTQPTGTHTIEATQGGRAIAVQPDGKIVVAGEANREATSSELLVARYLPNGEFDLSFGSGGEVALKLSTQSNPVKAMVSPTGKIYVAGPKCCAGGTPLFGEAFSVGGLLPNGQPDGSWGEGGRLVFPTPGAQGGVEAAALAPHGEILVSFEEETSTLTTPGNLVKFSPGGSLDPRFGSAGRIRVFPRVGAVDPSDIVTDPTGRIVGVGWNASITVFRLRSNGSTDRTFNGGQAITVPFGGAASGSVPYLVGLQSSGRIIAFGSSGESGCCKTFGLIGLRGGTSHARCLGHRATIVGTRGPDELTGTKGRDVISALGGPDRVRGLSGADLICGGKGRDTLYGGPGHDQVKE